MSSSPSSTTGTSATSQELTPVVYFSRSADKKVAHKLSNFAESWFKLDDRWWPTVEHYYQAHKYTDLHTFNGHSSASKGVHPSIFGMDPAVVKKSASLAGFKRQGRSPSKTFEAEKVEVMQRALEAKFALPEFSEVLRKTGKRPLHHYGRRPDFWDCHTDHATGAVRKGTNTHGKLLEALRSEMFDTPATAAASR